MKAEMGVSFLKPSASYGWVIKKNKSCKASLSLKGSKMAEMNSVAEL